MYTETLEEYSEETVITPSTVRIGLGPGETALTGVAVFFATLGVGGLASSASGIGGFFMGMGWLIVLWLVYQWALTVERPDGR
jgi:hypothetical protein